LLLLDDAWLSTHEPVAKQLLSSAFSDNNDGCGDFFEHFETVLLNASCTHSDDSIRIREGLHINAFAKNWTHIPSFHQKVRQRRGSPGPSLQPHLYIVYLSHMVMLTQFVACLDHAVLCILNGDDVG